MYTDNQEIFDKCCDGLKLQQAEPELSDKIQQLRHEARLNVVTELLSQAETLDGDARARCMGDFCLKQAVVLLGVKMGE